MYMSERMSDRAADFMSDRKSYLMPECMPDRMSIFMSDRMSEFIECLYSC